MNPKLLVIGLFLPWILWRYYQRIRQNIGRQPYKRFRTAAQTAGLAFLIGAMAYFTRGQTQILAGLLAGVAVGVIVGLIAIKLTYFELNSEGLYYTPNRYIGLGVAAILVIRLGYRFYHLYAQTGSTAQPAAALTFNPLTFLTVGLFLGYFLTYDVGLVWRYLRCGRQTT